MADGTLDSTQILEGTYQIYTGTAGSTPDTLLGYTAQNGATASFEIQKKDIMSDQSTRKVKSIVLDQKAKLAFTVLEATLDNIALALPGATVSGSTLTLGTATPGGDEISISLVGVDADNADRTVTMLYAEPIGNFQLQFGAGKEVTFNAEFEALQRSTTDFVTIADAGDNEITLSSGVATRVISQVLHLVNGEDSAADALTSITAADLVDNEIIRLKIADTDEPITLTHADGTLELVGDVNWTMTSLDDFIKLQYDEENTKWVEIQRFDAD